MSTPLSEHIEPVREEVERPIPEQTQVPNGPAAAAILASGIGAFVLGLLTTLAQARKAIAGILTFYAPVGPLSGKTTVAVVVWLVAWAILDTIWRSREARFGPVWTATLLPLALGLIDTFPPFYELFPSR